MLKVEIIEPQILPKTKKQIWFPILSIEKQICLFAFWKNLRLNNFVLISTDLKDTPDQVTSITLEIIINQQNGLQWDMKNKLPLYFRVSTMASSNGPSRWYHQGFSNGWFRIFIVSKTSQKEIWKFLCWVKRIFFKFIHDTDYQILDSTFM